MGKKKKGKPCLVLLALLALLLPALPATAADIPAVAKVTWTTPSTNANGLPIPATDITKYTLYWGTAPDKLTNKINLVPPTNAYNWSATLTADANGSATAYFAMDATSKDGTSALSAIVSKRFVLDGSKAPPSPPGNVIILTASCTAPSGWVCKVEPAP